MSWRELLPPWLVIVAGLTGIVLLCVSTKDVPVTPLKIKVRANGSGRGGKAGVERGNKQRTLSVAMGLLLKESLPVSLCLSVVQARHFNYKLAFCCFLDSLSY